MSTLSALQIDEFIHNGFVKIENAFPTSVADECRAILWKATGCNPDDPTSWKEPVIRIFDISLEPFRKASNTHVLHNAFDQLTGSNWVPRLSLGSFPIRFPVNKPAGDTGWHVDGSFPGQDSKDYSTWRVNIHSKDRALLMLFLFSDVTEIDAPTVIQLGSHNHVARLLAPHGEKGLSFMEVAANLKKLPDLTKSLATGPAGTVYLCHPFIVHAAQDHKGVLPKFMAQPPLAWRANFDVYQRSEQFNPVQEGILNALDMK